MQLFRWLSNSLLLLLLLVSLCLVCGRGMSHIYRDRFLDACEDFYCLVQCVFPDIGRCHPFIVLPASPLCAQLQSSFKAVGGSEHVILHIFSNNGYPTGTNAAFFRLCAVVLNLELAVGRVQTNRDHRSDCCHLAELVPVCMSSQAFRPQSDQVPNQLKSMAWLAKCLTITMPHANY